MKLNSLFFFRMMRHSNLPGSLIVAITLAFAGIATSTTANENPQIPTWSAGDLNFFLHGSMGTEFVPETALRAFIKANPDLFPKDDLSHLGAIPDRDHGWPIGFSRKTVPHLGGVSSIGINCAACHVGEITPAHGGANVRVLGMAAQLDVESFFGAVLVATFRAADPANMKKFLEAYLDVNDPQADKTGQKLFESKWQKQESKIKTVMTGNASESAPGLRPITAKELQLDIQSLSNDRDLAALAASMLNLFHNMRFALHIPDTPPPADPPNGPGRNDPWRLLAFSLLGVATHPAPVKFGIVWNGDQHEWVHYDGNTRSPIIRNLAASLGLGAPLVGHQGILHFADVNRHTTLSESIRPPKYPWAINQDFASRGAKTYQANCASCHDGPQSDARLHSIEELKTDPNRAKIFTQSVADGFNKFFSELEITGYRPPEIPPLRATAKYWSPSLAGAWARAPYLHNGSVPTMQALLAPASARPRTFQRGSRTYDPEKMGYTNEGAYGFDTAGEGNSNSGHEYGTQLSEAEKRDLIEYLKTL